MTLSHGAGGRITTTAESSLLQATSVKTPIRRGAAEIGRYFLGVCLPLGEGLLKLRRRGARKRARQRERSFGERGLQRCARFGESAESTQGFVPVGATPAGVARRRRGKRPGAVSQTVVLSLSPACSARNDARVARIVLYAGDIDKSRLIKDIGDRRRLVVAYLDRKHTAAG